MWQSAEGVLPGKTYEVQAEVLARGFDPVWTGWMEAATPPVQGVEIVDLSPELQKLIDEAHDGSDWVNAATEAAEASEVARQPSQAARDEAKRQADAAVLAKGGTEAASGRAIVAEESAGRSASSAGESARPSAEAKDAAGRSATAAATSDSSAAMSKAGAEEAASAASVSKAAETATRSVVIPLSQEIPAVAQQGVVFPVELYVERPVGYVAGSSPSFRVDFYAANGAGDVYLRCRIHRFDFEAVNANAVAAIAQKAKATVDGIASSSIGLRAKAGEEEALLELVALSNPQGSASAFRIRADQIKLEGEVDAETMIVGILSSEHVSTNTRLTLQEEAALSYGKRSLKDTKDGMFFGKNGSTGLGFSISRIRNDRRQSIGLTSGMFRILNARHAVTAQSRPVNLSYAVSTAKKALPAGVKTIQVQGVGGGGGQNEITGSLRTTSNNGTATTIHLYDGNTLKLTLTCPGGLGGTGGSADSRRSSAGRGCLPLKGRRDRPLCRLPVSGWWGWRRPDVGEGSHLERRKGRAFRHLGHD